MKTICLDRDQELNIPVGAVIRLKAMPDEDGQIIGYWIIDDVTDEPLDLVSVECVRVTATSRPRPCKATRRRSWLDWPSCCP